MKLRQLIVFALTLALHTLPFAQKDSAAGIVISEIASGLVSPRGLALGPDGALYVTEAGSGGSGPSVVLGNGSVASFGATSALTRVHNGVQQRVLSGLPSVATAGGLDAGGLQDIVFDGAGVAYGLFSFGSDAMQRDSILGVAGAPLGTIAVLPLDGMGSLQIIADITAHEYNANPAGGNLDSNPFSLSRNALGDFLVADAGANDFLQATPEGLVSTLAVLPARPNPLPIGPPVFQSVPTAIAVGPNGAYYVGQLTGFPFPPGAANVYQYDPMTGVLSIAHSGFTNIIDLTFDSHGDLFVSQLTSNGLASAMGPGAGQLIKIETLTGNRTTIASEGLFFPGAVLAGPDGSLYVTNRTNSPSGGQVLKLTAVPEPSSYLSLLVVGLTSLVTRNRSTRAGFRSSSGS